MTLKPCWHDSAVAPCCSYFSGAVGGKRTAKIVLWLSRNKPLAADFINVHMNTSQLPVLCIPSAHCFAPADQEPSRHFFLSCYFSKEVADGQEIVLLCWSKANEGGFLCLHRFTIVKHLFGLWIGCHFLIGNIFWACKQELWNPFFYESWVVAASGERRQKLWKGFYVPVPG